MFSAVLFPLLCATQSLTIVPLGDVDPFLPGMLARGISARLVLAPEVVPTQSLPESAFDRRRGQYLSPVILDRLAGHVEGVDSVRTCRLAVTEADLFAPGQSFVFGQADARTRVAVISLLRLREEYYGRRTNPRRFQDRALTEAVHELGHTLGMPHCPNPGCVMHASVSLAGTDRKSARFCAECRKRLPRGTRRGP
jgi:archaemetzincin